MNGLIDAYVALWNEPDAEKRRQMIADLWTEDGTVLTKTIDAKGHDEIAEKIGRSYQRFLETGQYVYKALDAVDGHHDMIRFYWTLSPTQGGDIASVGCNVFMLAEDGRIKADYQFIEA